MGLPPTKPKSVPAPVPDKHNLRASTTLPPTPPRHHAWLRLSLQIAAYLACSTAAYYGMWIRPARYYGLGGHFASTLTSGKFPDHPDAFSLKRRYIGVAFVDDTLTFLDVAFMPGIARWHSAFGFLQLYFLGGLLQPIAIWAVESVRRRNEMALISFIGVWSYIYQTNGIAVIMPLYFIAYTYLSNGESYWGPPPSLSSEVPLKYAKVLLPAILLGYALPTLLMFWPFWTDPDTVQNLTAFWQPSPCYVQVLLVVLGGGYDLKNIYQQHQQKSSPSTGANSTSLNRAKDNPGEKDSAYPYLKAVYSCTFVVGLVLHVSCIAYLTLVSPDPELTLKSVFWPDWSATPKPHGEGLRNMWLVDFYVFDVACVIWCCFAVWDLKSVGRLTPGEESFGVARASLLILLAQLVVGPGAAMSAVWYWREIALSRTLVRRK
ncbi:hypothetical protein A1O3_08217 [Capronia epimyces CBS 606.96]|uniref:Uncharacterized protein n=1 Tax=Capronia epimyces CBS 606.96 TaxID=1182542 RepID=W9XHF1_9EURO|nr:uncharacterized protein A1O3_08217 [Capronia epimyces CBS 606.96]EXJ79932.1 hypothetical protein A1O3_08217 [Capronia epimyces CBS 606.96]